MKYTTDELAVICAKHTKWLRDEEGGERANLQGANLRDANLRGADLRDANLQGADLDFSCLPLWCGGSRFKADSKIVLQILAHAATIEITDADAELAAVMESIKIIAKRSHRANALGLL